MRSSLVPTLPADRLPWQPIVLLSLATWFGASLLLDLLVMPTLYAGGMMETSEFASTGYALFGEFNHVELLLGATALTGLLAITQPLSQDSSNLNARNTWRAIWPALLLFIIPLLYTYGLTPQMSALGLSLDGSLAEAPAAMTAMHIAYWGMEMLKFGAIALLLYRLGGSFGLSGFNGGLDRGFGVAKPE